MPGPIIGAKDLATAAVTFQPARYDQVVGKAREVRCFAVFPAANAPVAVPHALGRVPTRFSVVSMGRGTGGAPGTVYVDDLPLAFSRYTVVLKCSTANTWADILLQ